MMKPPINSVRLSAVFSVSIMCVVADYFYFNINDNSKTTGCSEYEGSDGTALSANQCCADCARNRTCRGIVYNPATMTCRNIHTGTFPDKGCQAGSGADFFSLVCDRFLVSGPYGVADSQLSESSYYCGNPNIFPPICDPVEARYGSAKYARLNNTGMMTGGWFIHKSQLKSPELYIQVDFLKPTVVTRVVMQSRHLAKLGIKSYVTSFRFQHSDDCSAFENLADDNGEALLLEGNSNNYETIFRDLPKRVKARCFRINPVKWSGGVALRFDLIGCNSC